MDLSGAHHGPRKLVQAFPTWFGLSLFAGVERPAVESAERSVRNLRRA